MKSIAVSATSLPEIVKAIESGQPFALLAGRQRAIVKPQSPVSRPSATEIRRQCALANAAEGDETFWNDLAEWP